MERRKAASDRVKAAESTLDQVKFQSTILQKVNDMRLELEKYNYASATRRMAMYKKVQVPSSATYSVKWAVPFHSNHNFSEEEICPVALF